MAMVYVTINPFFSKRELDSSESNWNESSSSESSLRESSSTANSRRELIFQTIMRVKA